MHEAQAFYLLVAGAVGLAVAARIVVVRAQHTRRGELGRPYGHIELSLLGGDRRLAVLASLGALRAAGSVDAHSWGAFRAEAPLPDEATSVDRAVYAAAGRGASLVSLHKDETIAGAIAVVEEELRAAGALPRRLSRRFYGWIRWPMLGVITGGLTAWALVYHHSLGAALALLVTAAPIALITVAIVEDEADVTRSGRRTRERATAHDLGTAIALRGVEALWEADRTFAERGRLPHPEPPGSEIDE